jgi:hypothetical protein
VRSTARALAIAALAAVVAILAFPAFLALRANGTQIFEPQAMDFALLGVSTFAIALGLQLVPWRTSRRIALLGSLSAAALLLGPLAIFSIGLPLIPAGIVLLLLLYRALQRAPASWSRSRAAIGGAAVGFGAPLLLIAVLVPATVECFPNGAGTSSGRWRGSSQFATSTGTVSGDPGTSTGRSESADSIVTFR